MLVPIPNAGSRKSIALPAVSDASISFVAVALSPTHVPKPGASGFSSVRAVRGSTAESHSRFSLPFHHAQEKPPLSARRQTHCLQPHQRRPGQPRRQLYDREGPPPLVDAGAKFADSLTVLWVIRTLLSKHRRRLSRRAQLHLSASIVYDGSVSTRSRYMGTAYLAPLRDSRCRSVIRVDEVLLS